ncbi:MAG: TolC family protein, partial [Muribaculaceae bacterium]|nr:TolC family protein [Muribaculaceae bacterium]
MLKAIISALLSLVCLAAAAQDTVRISLPDAIARARSRSVDAAVALNKLRSAYWQYRTYRAELLPEVGFKATIPGYYKQYSSYQNADGTYSFVRNNYLNMSGELSVSQKLWFSGGTVSLNTSLDFIRQLSDSKDNRFMAIPVALTLAQPIFGVNTVKWNRRIEPERYAEAVAAFMSETEEVAMATINYFFNVLMARENVEIAVQNLRNAEKLYEVAREKR